jgi:hypothetical protein
MDQRGRRASRSSAVRRRIAGFSGDAMAGALNNARQRSSTLSPVGDQSSLLQQDAIG